jgi:hypothetical protein
VSISLLVLVMFGKGGSDASSWRFGSMVQFWSFMIALCIRFIWFKYNAIVTLTYSMTRLSFHSTKTPTPMFCTKVYWILSNIFIINLGWLNYKNEDVSISIAVKPSGFYGFQL